jgi:hypothetical protein
MGYSLEANEPLIDGVKRIAVEQIDLALYHLGAVAVDVNGSVHATRQSLKRLRALIALAHEGVGDRVFEREWVCYRKAGQLLAGARDATVVVETFDALVNRFSYEPGADAFAAQRHFLVERRDARLRLMVEEKKALEVFEMLASARERVANWPVKHSGFKAIRSGLIYEYSLGREGLRSVVNHPSPTDFHEWRRPVKLLWHQLQILTPIWPGVLLAHAEELYALSDRLNENHDLDVLRQVVKWSKFEAEQGDSDALRKLIDRRSRELEAEALPLGRRLFSERPRGFAERLQRYWRVWKHRGPDDSAVSVPARGITVAARTQQVS